MEIFGFCGSRVEMQKHRRLSKEGVENYFCKDMTCLTFEADATV